MIYIKLFRMMSQIYTNTRFHVNTFLDNFAVSVWPITVSGSAGNDVTNVALVENLFARVGLPQIRHNYFVDHKLFIETLKQHYLRSRKVRLIRKMLECLFNVPQSLPEFNVIYQNPLNHTSQQRKELHRNGI